MIVGVVFTLAAVILFGWALSWCGYEVPETLLGLVALALVILCLALPWTARAAEPAEPCEVVTTTAAPATYAPRTTLERIYYAAATCWRHRALDLDARVATATTSEARAWGVTYQREDPGREGASAETVLIVALVAALAGGTAGVLLSRK